MLPRSESASNTFCKKSCVRSDICGVLLGSENGEYRVLMRNCWPNSSGRAIIALPVAPYPNKLTCLESRALSGTNLGVPGPGTYFFTCSRNKLKESFERASMSTSADVVAPS
eukprot:scaffold30792_cov63-Phaeocystis_antarctica.AAC.2